MSDEEDNKANVVKLSNSYGDDNDDDCCHEIDPIDFYNKLSLRTRNDKLSLHTRNDSDDSDDDSNNDDEEVKVVSEKGQVVALRDFPHPRHLCANLPFKTTSHELYCSKCFCSVCEIPAPCGRWTGTYDHCHVGPSPTKPRFCSVLQDPEVVLVSEDEW